MLHPLLNNEFNNVFSSRLVSTLAITTHPPRCCEDHARLVADTLASGKEPKKKPGGLRPIYRDGAPPDQGPQFPNSLFPHGQIPGYSSANSRFQDSECADSWNILPGKFQIPSFRVSEAPSTDVLSQRDTHIPDSEFQRPPLAGSKPEGPSNSRFPVSEFLPSFRGPRLSGSTTNSVPDSECNTDLPCRARGLTYVESKFQNTESSFYFRSCTHGEPGKPALALETLLLGGTCSARGDT